jgi:hypothetical protein
MSKSRYARVSYDVSPRGDAWTVTRRGASRATAVLERKEDAVARAKEVAKAWRESQVVVRRGDGSIQAEHTYGTDPFPPRG